MSSMPPPPPPPPPGGFPPAPPPGYTPYGAAPAVSNYASFWARLGGLILDGILYGLVAAIFIVPAIVLGVASVRDCIHTTRADGTTKITCEAGQLRGGLLLAGIALGAVGLIVVLIVYSVTLGRTGQTWGRRIAGVKVVDKHTGAPIGFGRALGRTVMERIIDVIPVVGLINHLWMLWDGNKQTWHDKIVNAVVVKA